MLEEGIHSIEMTSKKQVHDKGQSKSKGQVQVKQQTQIQ